MIDVVQLLFRSRSGRRGLVWCVLTLAPAMVGLTIALSLQSALGEQSQIRFQRDIAESEASDVRRSSFTRPISAVDSRPVQVVTIAASPGSKLDWPGLDEVGRPGTALASAAVLELEHPRVAELTDTTSPGLLDTALQSFPGEFVVLRFVEPGELLLDAAPLAPGFGVPGASTMASPPTVLWLVAAAAVLLPSLALARASAVLFVARNSHAIAMARLFGATRSGVAAAVAGLVAMASLLAAALAVASVNTLASTGWTLRLDLIAVSARHLRLDLATILVVAGAGTLVALPAALVAARRLIDDPMKAVKPTPSGLRVSIVTLGAGALAAGATVVYGMNKQDLSDRVAVPTILVLVLALAIFSSRLGLEAVGTVASAVERRPVGALTSAIAVRLASESRALLTPLGWGGLVAGLTLGILPAVFAPPPEADLSFVLTTADVVDVDHVAGVSSSRHIASGQAPEGEADDQIVATSQLMVELDWTRPREEVIAAVGQVAPVALVESPRNQQRAATYQFAQVRATLLLALVTGLALTSVAYVAGVANAVKQVQPRFAALRLFGVRRSTCIGAGLRAVCAPLVLVLALPIASGVLMAQVLRDDDVPAWLVTPGWPLTVATSAAVILVLLVVVVPLGLSSISVRRNDD